MGHFSNDLLPAGEDARELAVVVHGLKRMILDHVPSEVHALLPHADVLAPRYDSSYFSNLDPVDLADELSALIEERCAAHERVNGRPYERIILIGHSRGALLVRKAFVFACGQNQELWRAGLQPKPKSWPSLVTRIILMAGLNRGWSLTPKPPAMSAVKWLSLRLACALTRLLGIATLLRDLQRGAPFVANLRVQWINLVRAGRCMPVTVQILGNSDDIVHPGDNIDLQSGAGFIYLNAPRGTGHANVVDLSDPARRAVFARALLTPDIELESEYRIPKEQEQDTSVRQVVFIMHGIRDFGDWCGRFESVVQRQAMQLGRRVETITSSYGYFPMLKFLLFAERQRNVRWFMDQYTEALARFPGAEMEFLGHSNGTYLLAGALRRYAACSFHRAAFAGSVVPRDFPWDDMLKSGRIRAIRNYVATGDWVVGVFPHLFEPFGDVGAAGLFGFTTDAARDVEVRFVKGGHGAAIAESNFDPIAAFLLNGDLIDPPPEIRETRQAGPVLLASKLCWAVWMALFGVLLASAWWIVFAWPAASAPEMWVRLTVFVLLVLALLASV